MNSDVFCWGYKAIQIFINGQLLKQSGLCDYVSSPTWLRSLQVCQNVKLIFHQQTVRWQSNGMNLTWCTQSISCRQLPNAILLACHYRKTPICLVIGVISKCILTTISTTEHETTHVLNKLFNARQSVPNNCKNFCSRLPAALDVFKKMEGQKPSTIKLHSRLSI